MDRTEGFGVNIWSPTVNAVVTPRVGDEIGSEIVVLPNASAPERSRVITVLSTVCSGTGDNGCIIENEACWVGCKGPSAYGEDILR